jgi:xanthine dehydrogenase small subunit
LIIMAPSVVIALLDLSLLCVAWLMILKVVLRLPETLPEIGQRLTEELVKDSLTGNLCRCTGYEAIINAGMAMDIERFKPLASLYNEAEIVANFKAHASQELLIEVDGRKAFNPTSLASANRFLADNDKVVIVSGGTDVSVNMNKRGLAPKAIMSTSALPGLDDLKMVETAEKARS